jgi:hypothetical protein
MKTTLYYKQKIKALKKEIKALKKPKKIEMHNVWMMEVSYEQTHNK